MIANRTALERTSARGLALDCLEAGLAAADPERVVAETISFDGERMTIDGSTYDLGAYDEVLVVGGGNAAGRVAAALEGRLGDRIDGGAVVTDSPADATRVEMCPGDHPIPSERGVESTHRVMELVSNADERSLVLAVVTGGASALMPAPATDVSLSALQAVTDGLLASGATIDEINAVRKHLSALKGGGLARAASPATVVGLVLSDVVGNDLSVVASGPTAPDESTFADALAVLERYDIEVPETVRDRLERGASGELAETPGPDDPLFEHVHNHVLADGFTPLAAAVAVAAERGFEPLVLSSRVRGEAREAAKTHVAIAEESLATGNPVSPPAVLLSGGETTVTIRGDGRGGPNQEFALSAALELGSGITLAAIDTDGIDGATEVAGALVDVTTVEDPARARTALDDNDAFTYLAARGDVIETGPTGTNLNDMRVVVVEE